MSDLTRNSWPAPRLSEALEALARRSGFSPRETEVGDSPHLDLLDNDERLGRWLDANAQLLGVEIEPVMIRYPDLKETLSRMGPALIRLPGGGEPRFLALLAGRGEKVRLLAPDLSVQGVQVAAVRQALSHDLAAPAREEMSRLLEEASVAKHRRARAIELIMDERLVEKTIGGCWMVRQPPGAGFWRQIRSTSLPRLAAGLGVLHALQYSLWIVAWWLIGKGALEGSLDPGWLVAWALLLLTLIPFRLTELWWQGRLAIEGGALLKRRLLEGALRLEPEEIRHQGSGQHLGRVIESEAVESLALNGGFLGIVAAIEVVAAAIVLALGAGGLFHAVLLVGWLVVVSVLAWKYYRDRARWTEKRLALTNSLVEDMMGHRTRLAQISPRHWHDEEDPALERYLQQSAAMDRSGILLDTLGSRGWMLVGLAGLAPAFVGGGVSAAALAVSLGGIILAYRAIDQLVDSLVDLGATRIAWSQVGQLFHSAGRSEPLGSPVFAVSGPRESSGESRSDQILLDASELSFRYRGREEAVIHGCSLRLRDGDRVLLQGPSGGGKSTLAALLSGLRLPQSGILLLRGLDRQTIGSEGWLRRVATAPQFHENHVLAGSLAFNLLMGRRWPAAVSDFEEAEEICRELGLGELLDRMPSGLLQLVGESGWQLSHGERSRLYIARTLLQGADLILLDESFGALDPESLEQAMSSVLQRSPTLVVIAHP